MKKKAGRLSLNRETIRELEREVLAEVNGGTSLDCPRTFDCPRSIDCPRTDFC